MDTRFSLQNLRTCLLWLRTIPSHHYSLMMLHCDDRHSLLLAEKDKAAFKHLRFATNHGNRAYV